MSETTGLIGYISFKVCKLMKIIIIKQESCMAYGTVDEALSTVLVMFKKMFLF